MFRVGSITKTFTAVAVMQSAEQGVVDLDAPAADYLRAYPLIPADAGWRPATLRHLLTHTAGIGEMLHPWGLVRPCSARRWRRAGRCRRCPRSTGPGCGQGRARHAVPVQRPRFATLGQIVEDVTGQPFGDYLREHVFAPLGMADTDLLPPHSTSSRLATGYNLETVLGQAARVVQAGGAGRVLDADMARSSPPSSGREQ